MSKPTVAELLETPTAFLTRTHLRELGLERTAIDGVFRALPTIYFPGYSRPMIRVADFLALIEERIANNDRVVQFTPLGAMLGPRRTATTPSRKGEGRPR